MEKNQNITIKKVEQNYYKEQIYIFEYKEIVRELIIKYKFNDCSYLYRTFSTLFSKNKKLLEILKTYDKIIPVPISKKRLKERGYNQSELIAKEIAKIAGINFENNSIIKIKNNKRQSELSKKEREENVIGTYKLKENIINTNQNILLFDDIITTGNTLKECSKILIKTNPKKIGIFTIAKD